MQEDDHSTNTDEYLPGKSRLAPPLTNNHNRIVRVISDGTSFGTKILDIDGRQIDNIESIDIHIDNTNAPTTVWLKVAGIQVQIVEEIQPNSRHRRLTKI